MLNRISEDVLVNGVGKYLCTHDISMCCRVLRKAKLMYKSVTTASITLSTNVKKLQQHCPNISTLYVKRNLIEQTSNDNVDSDDSDDIDAANDDEPKVKLVSLEQKHDTVDYINEPFIIQLLPIKRLIFNSDLHCRYKMRLDKLEYLEANTIYHGKYPMLKEIKFVDSCASNICNNSNIEIMHGQVTNSRSHNNGHLYRSLTIDGSEVEYLDDYPNITSLTLEDDTRRDDICEELPELGEFSELKLTYLKLDRYVLPQSFCSMNLRHLELIGPETLPQLNMPNLEILKLHNYDVDCKLLVGMHIRSLELVICRVKNDEELIKLPLKILVIEDTIIPRIRHVLKHIKLTELNIDVSIIDRHKITNLPKLDKLYISDAGVSYADILNIDLPLTLTDLTIDGSILTIKHYVQISRMPLRSLTLHHVGLNDNTILYLKNLDLRYLDIKFNQVTYEGILSIKHLPLTKLICDNIPIIHLLR